ncbi:hypothetical protein F5Y04DRAFT_151569 [Hypomontagnella monticulosa]|nr:hypothetical protein F5Y04DRAFT_151569 [Hypomontagnella monticulosa]
MGYLSPERYQKMRDAKGPTTCLRAGLPAYEENSRHGKLFKFAGVSPDHAVHNTDEAAKFVEDRVEEGVDYIKVIADSPGHDQAVLDKIQVEAQKQGKMTVAHAAQYISFERSLRADFDILTHVPMDKALDDNVVARMVRQKTIAVPTLAMMEVMSKSWAVWGITWLLEWHATVRNFQYSLDSVAAMHQAGVTILAGTDANNSGIATIVPGKSLHHELELLVRAGLMPIEVLKAATSLAAQHFDLQDRGRISPGLRADLILVRGNPDEDITATQRISRVWSGGEEVPMASEGLFASLGSCAVI